MKIELCNELKILNEEFKKHNTKLYVVGGYVRDYLLNGKISEDIDVCSEITPDDFISKGICSKKIDVYNKKLGSVHINIKNKVIEHTTFRVEAYGDDGSHSPLDVEFVKNINYDAMRRDFTCNSIYYDIQEDKIIDIYGGETDIKNKIIRTIETPDYVFASDGERIMRMVRFACSLDFEIDEETFREGCNNVWKLEGISQDRLIREFKKILLTDNYKKGIKYLAKLGAFKYILPSVDILPISKKIDNFMQEDMLKNDISPTKRFSCLMVNIAKKCYINCYDKEATLEGIISYILENEKLGLTSKERNDIINSVLFFEDFESAENENEKKAILLDNMSSINLIKELWKDENYIEARKLYEDLMSKNIALTLQDFCVKSGDLIKLGYKGKEVGDALNDLLLYSVINENNNREEILNFLKTYWKGNN